MAYYAFLDEYNVVTEVITGKDEGEDGTDWEHWYGQFRGQNCKRTSFNTHHGLHIAGKTPFRKNFAGIGYHYDPVRDAFIPPRPFESWHLNEASCQWEAPVAKPNDGLAYYWDESALQWVPV